MRKCTPIYNCELVYSQDLSVTEFSYVTDSSNVFTSKFSL